MDLQTFIKNKKAFFTRRTTGDNVLTGDDIIRGRKISEDKKCESKLTLDDLKKQHSDSHIKHKSKPETIVKPRFTSKCLRKEDIKFSPMVYKKPEQEEIKQCISNLKIRDIKKFHFGKCEHVINYQNVPNAKLRTEFISLKKAIELKK